jgi:hypothetical protein
VAEDKRRRAQLRLRGLVVLEDPWREIVYDRYRVIREVRQALAGSAAAAAG